jgi:TatD DNase family protein
MYLIDSHTHLFLEEFDTDRNLVVERALNQSIHKMLLPNVDSSTINKLTDTCKINPKSLFPAIGLHPCSVKDNYQVELDALFKVLQDVKFCAIGEIGIDLFWDKTYYNEQVKVLEMQIGWALHYNLPVILHCRESFEHVYNIVKKYKALRGVFHAFTGTLEQAKKIMDLGFFVGIGGIVTFKNSGLDKIVSEIPLENIVLETDSPYLTPVPYRGKRNEPAYIKHIAKKLSDIFACSLEETAKMTSLNTENLFAI